MIFIIATRGTYGVNRGMVNIAHLCMAHSHHIRSTVIYSSASRKKRTFKSRREPIRQTQTVAPDCPTPAHQSSVLPSIVHLLLQLHLRGQVVRVGEFVHHADATGAFRVSERREGCRGVAALGSRREARGSARFRDVLGIRARACDAADKPLLRALSEFVYGLPPGPDLSRNLPAGSDDLPPRAGDLGHQMREAAAAVEIH